MADSKRGCDNKGSTVDSSNAAGQTEVALAPWRVLDFTGELGAYSTKLLADMGADVIRVEKPGGDETRRIGPFVGRVPDPERSLHFFHYNWNKRSVTLNLESSDCRPILDRLVEAADVVIHTFPPSYAGKVGMQYERLKDINPALIVTAITGFGSTGPYKDWQSSDMIGAAMGGLLYTSGAPDSPPVIPFGSQAYHVTSLYAAFGTMCAVFFRNITGRGQFVDVSMQECVASVTDIVNLFYIYGKRIVKRMGTEHPLTAPARVYSCKDGEVVVGGFNRELLAWMDSEGMAGDLKDDDRWLYDEFRRQPENRKHIDQLIARWVEQHTKAELFERGQQVGVRVGPVLTAEELLECPHLLARSYWVEMKDPETHLKLIDAGAPYKFGETPWQIRRRAPHIGEHNEEIYVQELAIAPEELSLLAGNGVV